MIKYVKNIRKHLTQLALILAIIFAVSSQLNSCYTKKDLIKAQSNNMQLLFEGQKMNEKINAQGKTISYQEAQYFDEKSKNENLIERIGKLENKISEFHTKTITIVDSVFIPISLVDTLFLGSESLVNYHFVKKDTNLFLKGYANRNNLFIDTLLIPNSATITHKWERENFLSKKSYLIEVENSNPYIKVLGMNNYTFVEEKKWHEKRGFNFGLGLIVGLLVFSKK